MPITNALSIDVEDYFQVSASEKIIDRDSWERLDHHVEGNMDTIFTILSDKGVKATFLPWDGLPGVTRLLSTKLCAKGTNWPAMVTAINASGI